MINPLKEDKMYSYLIEHLIIPKTFLGITAHKKSIDQVKSLHGESLLVVGC